MQTSRNASTPRVHCDRGLRRRCTDRAKAPKNNRIISIMRLYASGIYTEILPAGFHWMRASQCELEGKATRDSAIPSKLQGEFMEICLAESGVWPKRALSYHFRWMLAWDSGTHCGKKSRLEMPRFPRFPRPESVQSRRRSGAAFHLSRRTRVNAPGCA